jgi:hypothetical protein
MKSEKPPNLCSAEDLPYTMVILQSFQEITEGKFIPDEDNRRLENILQHIPFDNKPVIIPVRIGSTISAESEPDVFACVPAKAQFFAVYEKASEEKPHLICYTREKNEAARVAESLLSTKKPSS